MLQQLKSDLLQIRKSKTTADWKIDALTIVLSEIQRVATLKEKRPPTEDEIISVIKNQIKKSQEFQSQIKSEERKQEVQNEIDFLSSYLPQQLSDTELEKAIKHYLPTLFDIGSIMKALNTDFPNRFDKKRASEIAKALLAK